MILKNNTLPAEFIDSLKHVEGFDKDSFIQIHQEGESLTSIRLNAHKPIDGDINWHAIPWTSDGYYLSERISFTSDPLFQAGCYYVQEASSMFLQHLLKQVMPKQETPIRVLDLCAAPGGKSTLVASLLGKKDMLVANEVIKSRVLPLIDNLNKWGNANVVVTNNDPQHFSSLVTFFDIVLVDAPCSGSGMFRKDPDTVKQWSLENVKLCAKRQQRILSDIIPTLKSNAVLIYATCSYSREENEEILDYLVDNFELENIKLEVEQKWNIVATQSPKYGVKGYRFYPNKVRGEGFFIACFRNKAVVNAPQYKERKLSLVEKTMLPILSSFIENAQNWVFIKVNDEIYAIPEHMKQDVTVLQYYAYIKKSGICMGKILGKELIPHHQLAQSNHLSAGVHRIELTKEQALIYLRRDNLILDNISQGWVVFTHQGHVLGWAKMLPNRVNNYFPKELRILK